MKTIKVMQSAFETKAVDGELPIKIQEAKDAGRVIRFVASSDAVDRDGEVILQDGWDFTDFVKNPALIYMHDYWTLPIGKNVAIGVVDDRLMIDSEFDPPEIDELADKIFQKIQYGTLRAGSVGFIPIETADPKKDAKIFQKYSGAKRIFKRQQLLEWTICPIGANQDAVTATMKRLCKAWDAQPDETAKVEKPDIEEAEVIARLDKILRA